MSDPFAPFAPWQPTPAPPRPAGPGVVVIVLAAVIGALLVTGGVTVAVKTSSSSVAATASATTTTTSPGSDGSAPELTSPSTTPTQPATSAPATTRPGIAPVSPVTVAPVIAPPVTAQRLNLAPSVIAAMVNPAVVDIDTKLAYQHAIAAGTGMVLTANGVVLTNNHVIDGATSIGAVSIGSGRSYTAHVLGVDPTADVALIQLDGASGLKTITTSSTAVNLGDPVVAIGNAGGVGGSPSVTSGFVQALNQSIIANDPAAGSSEQLDGLIETSASLQPGDSGGPLLNGSGQVVGIDTVAVSATATSGMVSFAIPIEQAMAIARQIQGGQASATVHLGLPPFLGVQATSGGGRSGALVNSVLAGGPAAGVGLVAGSVIVAINGQTIDSATTLSAVLRQYRPGNLVTLNWVTPAGAGRSARVTLGTGPAD